MIDNPLEKIKFDFDFSRILTIKPIESGKLSFIIIIITLVILTILVIALISAINKKQKKKRDSQPVTFDDSSYNYQNNTPIQSAPDTSTDYQVEQEQTYDYNASDNSFSEDGIKQMMQNETINGGDLPIDAPSNDSFNDIGPVENGASETLEEPTNLGFVPTDATEESDAPDNSTFINNTEIGNQDIEPTGNVGLSLENQPAIIDEELNKKNQASDINLDLNSNEEENYDPNFE